MGQRDFWLALLLTLAALPRERASAAETTEFRAGTSCRDITPPEGLPMWGYGARHDAPAEGTLDPLNARAIVIACGSEKLAIVGLDLGRGPTAAMMDLIRREVASRAGIQHVLICGSHTHHGPVIELTDAPGSGQGKFDRAVAYTQQLPHLIVEAIVEANTALRPARLAVGSKALALNRNRHTRREPKAVDPLLYVMRFDDDSGQPMAVLVNFAAHPVMTDNKLMKYSADYPGFLQKKVESELKARCVFIQGAAGDLSVQPGEGVHGPQAYGELLADHALEVARSLTPEPPRHPALACKVDRFKFESRIDLTDPGVVAAYSKAFFPEIVQNFAREWPKDVDAELSTVLLNGEIVIVGGSGEFFCNHALRLRERAYVPHTLFFGYCNGHSMYFPTIEAASEGGYGADPGVSFVALGAGEQMMNQALINVYALLGKLKVKKP